MLPSMRFPPKTLRTVRDYLKSEYLPDWVSELAFNNVKNEFNLDYKVTSLHDAIELAFYWDDTLEGVAFWETLANTGKCRDCEIEVEFVDGPKKGIHKIKNNNNFIDIDHYTYKMHIESGRIKYYILSLD